MGAIDLVVQIESPPSVASGLQRIGRAGHQAGAISEGIIFPKFRGDLLACAAVTRAMHDGQVEATHYPRNPLDVLAQQIVAMAAMEPWTVDDMFARVRQAAPFRELESRDVRRRAGHALGKVSLGRVRRASATHHLGSRAGRDHRTHRRQADRHRQRGHDPRSRSLRRLPRRRRSSGAGRRARRRDGLRDRRRRHVHAGRVHLARRGDHPRPRARLARAWRAGQDAVLARRSSGPARRTGHGDRQAHSRSARDSATRRDRSTGSPARSRHAPPPRTRCAISTTRLPPVQSPTIARSSSSDVSTISATGASVCCRRSAVACMRPGRWRSPRTFAARPVWTSRSCGVTKASSSDFPKSSGRRIRRCCCPEPEEIEGLVLRQLGSTSLFAARFRETAARALLLPRRRPGMRTPLWQQRKRASDLLAVASRFGSFPALLETYREVLRDHFDMPALVDVLRRVSKTDDPGRDDRFDDAVTVRGFAALQLRRQLHLRRRCSTRRAARAGTLGRSGPAPRAAWRRGAA